MHRAALGSGGQRAPQGTAWLTPAARVPTGLRAAGPVTGSSAGLIGRDKHEEAGTGQVGGFSETRDGARNPEKTEMGWAGERSCPTGAALGTGAETGARPPPRP